DCEWGATVTWSRRFLCSMARTLKAVSILLMALSVSACSFVPREGPLAIEVEQQSADNDYVTVDVDANVVRILSGRSNIGLGTRFERSTKAAPSSTIGIGDALSITI